MTTGLDDDYIFIIAHKAKYASGGGLYFHYECFAHAAGEPALDDVLKARGHRDDWRAEIAAIKATSVALQAGKTQMTYDEIYKRIKEEAKNIKIETTSQKITIDEMKEFLSKDRKR